MKTNVLIIVFAFIFSFSLNAQERRTLAKQNNVSSEKQILKPNAENLGQLQGRKLAKHLSLSEDQYYSVTSLIQKHLKGEKYQKLMATVASDNVQEISKSKTFEQDFVSAELFKDQDFTKELSTIIDEKQMGLFNDLVKNQLSPK
ncbi:hypothetical protein [Paucihalobacter sp.]|uniref:hypothetical protein n=1 Tax=Paucihalobacter sp. TaxID=2850405 RepID=UPI002FE1741A